MEEIEYVTLAKIARCKAAYIKRWGGNAQTVSASRETGKYVIVQHVEGHHARYDCAGWRIRCVYDSASGGRIAG